MGFDVDINEFLQSSIENNLSRLFLESGQPPRAQQNCEILSFSDENLEPEDAARLFCSIASEEHIAAIEAGKEVDFEYPYSEDIIFRVRAVNGEAGISMIIARYRLYMDALLHYVVDNGVSDLHLEVGVAPVVRLHGDMTPIEALPVLEAKDMEGLVRSIAKEGHMQEIEENGGADFGFAFFDRARFRVSAFKQKGVLGMVLRQIPTTLLTMEQLGLPPKVKELLYKPRGLILVTGPTGSGKSTTLASMIHLVNLERKCHVITIEDPIEFYHQHRKSVVIQREIGRDVPSFAEALRRALRQDPDIILVGEMRDVETIGAAVSAAETGHLVFGTLHTTGAARTVDRMVDAFPTDQQEQIRTQLASSLVAVISQVLLPRCDKKGRVAAFEIMVATPSIQSLIRDNKTFRITSDIQTGAKYGMNTLDSHLLALFKEGKITREEMMLKVQDAEGMLQKLAQEEEEEEANAKKK